MALKRIGAKFEHYLICEWEIHSVASYKAIHMPYDNVDYSDGVDSEKIIEELTKLGISADGKTALSENQIRSHSNGEAWRRNCYNNIKATHNLVNICATHGNDLKIIDTEHFTYLLTLFRVRTYLLPGSKPVCLRVAAHDQDFCGKLREY